VSFEGPTFRSGELLRGDLSCWTCRTLENRSTSTLSTLQNLW